MTSRRKNARVDYQQVGKEYLEHRQLKKGAAGWVLLAGLGVAYVISGDFAGWNFGLAEGGWGGLLIATFIGGYIEALGLFGLTSGWPIYLACYLIFIGIHLYGVGEALRLTMAIT